MSENLDLVRHLIESVTSGDFEAVESCYEGDALLVGAEVGRFQGAAAIRGMWEDFRRPFRDIGVEIEEIADFGNEVAYVVIIVRGHPHGSSAEARVRFAAVGVFARGVILRQTNFMDIDEARAAAERLAEERG